MSKQRLFTKTLVFHNNSDLNNQTQLILAIDFPGGKRNCNIKIRAQLRILKCIARVKEATRKVLKHVY